MLYESTRCDLCGCVIHNPEVTKCPNCDTAVGDEPARESEPYRKAITLRFASVEGPGGKERLATLPEPWPELVKLATELERVQSEYDGDDPPRMDLQNSLNAVANGALAMAQQEDPRCSVVGGFLRSLGYHLAGQLGDFGDLELHIRQTAPQFPSWLPGESLAESIGRIRDGLRSPREGVEGPIGHSLEDLPRWEVNVQSSKPAHAIHKAVIVQAPDPLTARMVALNVARERWPGEDFTAVSAVPHLSTE